MKVLNLGCGTKTSPKAINVDWSIYLSIKRSYLLTFISTMFLSSERRRKLQGLDKNIVVHNITKRLPFGDNSIHVVYHSHVLEHLDSENAPKFLKEIRRILVPGGIHRIVVPDMEYLCRAYLNHVAQIEGDQSLITEHDQYISKIIEQMVRKEAYGTRRQPALRKWLENLILGDARKRGETHQWMYDRFQSVIFCSLNLDSKKSEK